MSAEENLGSKMIPFTVRGMHTNFYRQPDPYIADDILFMHLNPSSYFPQWHLNKCFPLSLSQ